MQTTLLLTLLAAAVGINAAPSLSPRLTSIPVRVYDGPGCNSGPAATTANIPTDGLCFGIAPRLTQTTSSAMIHTDDLRALPAGCTSKWIQAPDTRSQNTNGSSHPLLEQRLQQRQPEPYPRWTVLHLRCGSVHSRSEDIGNLLDNEARIDFFWGDR